MVSTPSVKYILQSVFTGSSVGSTNNNIEEIVKIIDYKIFV